MKISRIVIILIAALAILAVLAAGYKYFFTFKIASSPIINNEQALKNYLGEGGFFTIPLRFKGDNGSYTYINSIAFSILKNQPSGDVSDCTAPTVYSDPMFCFTETVKAGQMTINIYSDEGIIHKPTSSREKTALFLNSNLFSIFENRLGISQSKRKPFMTGGEATYLFSWQ